MSVPVETPFTPSYPSILSLGSRLTELGITPTECQIVGARALYLQGLVAFSGRADLIVGEETFDAIGDRLLGSKDLVSVAEENTVAVNDWMVYYPRGRKNDVTDQVHIFSRLVAEPEFDLGSEVTLRSLAGLVWPARGFNTIDPVTSVNWLMARGIRTDRGVAFAGLRSLRGFKVHDIGRLSGRADTVWPKPHNSSLR